MEISIRTISTARENIVGRTDVSTMASGSTTRWKAKALSLGATAEGMRATIRMTKSMDMVHSNGLMAESISVSGVKVNNTEKECTSKRAKRDKASGRWARESSGSRISQAMPKIPCEKLNLHFE